ncbi:MAG: FliM/FliN family flagellar motor switch protein [Mariprofundaceae bacterium]
MSDEDSGDQQMTAEAKPVLEPEEIDALMASMAPDEQAEAMFASLPPLTQPESVEAYDFSHGGDRGPNKYPLFVNVQERMVEALSEQWADVFQREVTTSDQGIAEKKYLDIISDELRRVYFVYVVEGYGRMMVTFETSLIVAYVDAMLGGKGESYGEVSESLSPVEQRLAKRIASALEVLLEDAWKPVHIMDFELFKLDTDPQFLSVAGSAENCFSMDFEIRLGEGSDEDAKGLFSLHYPRSFLEPMLDDLSSTASDDTVAVDEVWKAAMGQAMESIPLSLRVVFGSCTMDIGHFLKLSPGDMLPLNKAEQEPAVLSTDSMPMFHVMAGSQDGKLAFEIMNEINHGGAS